MDPEHDPTPSDVDDAYERAVAKLRRDPDATRRMRARLLEEAQRANVGGADEKVSPASSR